jgi:hypothetical protein
MVISVVVQGLYIQAIVDTGLRWCVFHPMARRDA